MSLFEVYDALALPAGNLTQVLYALPDVPDAQPVGQLYPRTPLHQQQVYRKGHIALTRTFTLQHSLELRGVLRKRLLELHQGVDQGGCHDTL